MKTINIRTADLKPGMISANAAYTSSNHLLIQSNTTLTPDIIDKLKHYSIKSIKVYLPEKEATAPGSDTESQPGHNVELHKPTYFERVQESEDFAVFREAFTASVNTFKQQLNDIVVKNSSEIIDNMLEEVDKILSHTRNPLHLLDMLQCLRGFDDMTYMHSMNVALICNVIGGWINLPEEEKNQLIICGLLHDIGKLQISPDIILKPGKLTDEEFEQIRTHPKLGYDILCSKDLDERVKLAALQHHERYNGTGYPGHLPASEISFFSSIVAVADVYDAMTSNRVYRKGICPFKVIGILEKEKDLYDPSILYLFMKRTVEAYINSEVILSNNEQGKVVLINQHSLSRPVVLADTQTYDLSKIPGIEIETLI